MNTQRQPPTKPKPMIDKTQRKLREAEFFYRRLLEVLERKWMNEPEAFRHFFSAFIQAARSVQWVLQSEQKQKYDAWHPAWESQLKPDDRKLLKLTATLRNEEAKEGGAIHSSSWKRLLSMRCSDCIASGAIPPTSKCSRKDPCRLERNR